VRTVRGVRPKRRPAGSRRDVDRSRIFGAPLLNVYAMRVELAVAPESRAYRVPLQPVRRHQYGAFIIRHRYGAFIVRHRHDGTDIMKAQRWRLASPTLFLLLGKPCPPCSALFRGEQVRLRRPPGSPTRSLFMWDCDDNWIYSQNCDGQLSDCLTVDLIWMTSRCLWVGDQRVLGAPI
jgi:hypothetical protein